MDEVRWLGDQGVSKYFPDAHIIASMQVIGRHLHADATFAQAMCGNELLKMGDRVLNAASAPAMDFIDERIVAKFVDFPLSCKDGKRTVFCRNEQALEFLIALGVRSRQPMDGNGMEGDEPIHAGLDKGCADTLPAVLK